MGISKINPVANVRVAINETYESRLISLLTKSLTLYEPKKLMERGAKKKYPNKMPAKNKLELKNTNPRAYFISLKFNAGFTNRHNSHNT